MAPDASPAGFEEHFLRPRGQGALPDATHAACVEDPACGDELTLELRVVDGLVDLARFRVRGCSGSIAVGSALATLLPGRAARADALTREELAAEIVGMPPGKQHVLRLAQRAFEAALQSSSIT